MSSRKQPFPAKLVISSIFRDERILETVLPLVSEVAGEVCPAGPVLPFDRTEYYHAEMGKPLFRRFFAASNPVSRDALPKIKIGMEEIELKFSNEGRRTVNLDPGLLTPENFILATGKNFSHRIYLGQGVFADLTLIFQNGEYRPLPWTYPDYASPEIRNILKELRADALSLRPQ